VERRKRGQAGREGTLVVGTIRGKNVWDSKGPKANGQGKDCKKKIGKGTITLNLKRTRNNEPCGHRYDGFEGGRGGEILFAQMKRRARSNQRDSISKQHVC